MPLFDSSGQHPFEHRNGLRVDAYRPRVEGLYARIERWLDETSGISYWRRISRDNVTSVFGQSAESRIADPDNPRRIFRWLLETMADGKGNVIRYH